MKYSEFIEFREVFFEYASKISDQKSIEYTISNEDKFYNFKHVAERLGITAQQALMVYVLKHVDAICNDAKTGEVVSDETSLSRAHDVVNYMILYAALKTENNTEDKPNHDHHKPNKSGTTTGDSMRNRTSFTEPPKWEGLP